MQYCSIFMFLSDLGFMSHLSMHSCLDPRLRSLSPKGGAQAMSLNTVKAWVVLEQAPANLRGRHIDAKYEEKWLVDISSLPSGCGISRKMEQVDSVHLPSCRWPGRKEKLRHLKSCILFIYQIQPLGTVIHSYLPLSCLH